MNDNTIIRGWTINQGDYLRNHEYDNAFLHVKKKEKRISGITTFFMGIAVLVILILTLNVLSQ